MDIKQPLDKRTGYYKEYNNTDEVKKYDYGKYGILSKSLPKILFKGNKVLVTFLQLLDVRIIMMFKYIDKLKRFKWISWY